MYILKPTLVAIPIVFIWILKLDQVPLCSDKKARNEMKLGRWVKICHYLYTQWMVGCFKLDLKKMSGVLFLRSFPNGSTDASTKTIVVVFSKDHNVVMKQLTNSSS